MGIVGPLFDTRYVFDTPLYPFLNYVCFDDEVCVMSVVLRRTQTTLSEDKQENEWTHTQHNGNEYALDSDTV